MSVTNVYITFTLHLHSITKIILSVIKVNVNKVNVKVNVNKVNDKVNDIYFIHSHYKGAGLWPLPRMRRRSLQIAASIVFSFVLAMNRVDVVAVSTIFVLCLRKT